MTWPASVLNSGAHSFRFLGSQKSFLTFPYPVPVPKNCVIFIGCNFKSRASQARLHNKTWPRATEKIVLVAKPGDLLVLVSTIDLQSKS